MPTTLALSLVFGVIPQHQGKGIKGVLIKDIDNRALNNDYPYKVIEMNWIGNFNPTIRKVAGQIGAKVRKTHVTLRCMYDHAKEVTPPRRVSYRGVIADL